MDKIYSHVKPSFLKPNDEVLLTSYETEHLVETMRPFTIDKVGSCDWLEQHENIEKINLQAHYNALANCDDYVMNALISHEKMTLMIHELLIIEAWMEHIFPLIRCKLTQGLPSICLNSIICHEATLVNLLEVLLYHKEACEAFSYDGLVELVDYCHRKLVYLNTQAHEDSSFKEKDAKQMIQMDIEEEISEKVMQSRFNVAIGTLTILRFLIDNIVDLPLCLMTRALDYHHIILVLVPLIENCPWTRKRKRDGIRIVENYHDGKWIEVDARDLQVSKPCAQVWLCLYNLIVEPSCKERFIDDDYHCKQIVKLRKYLSEDVINQIPILKDLKWIVEEMSLNLHKKAPNVKSRAILLEQVPTIRSKIAPDENWDCIATTSLENSLNATSKFMKKEKLQEILERFHFRELLEEPKCAKCGVNASLRCSRCKNEWYCGRPCQVESWKNHKKICDTLSKGN